MNSKFIEIGCSKQSISRRRLVRGVGVNDSNYITSPKINGKIEFCPYYQRWIKMIRRCYSENPKDMKNNKSYFNCTVSDEWLLFSNFKKWMKSQNWEGKELDKDVMFPGNKIYSEKTCVFVPKNINMIVHSGPNAQTRLPIGVSVHSKTGLYRSRCKNKGREISLGYYKNKNDAEKAYKDYKYKMLIDESAKQTDKRIISGLIRHAELIAGFKNAVIT